MPSKKGSAPTSRGKRAGTASDKDGTGTKSRSRRSTDSKDAETDAEKTVIAGTPDDTSDNRGEEVQVASGSAPETKTVKPGDVLNDIFEVRRLIGRGGMGEVFEGINISSEEPVAIKVILPHLAKDPKVLAMFRREALLLTRISHPAIVQYRVLAHEPKLGVFYIVTDFIGGDSLSQDLRKLDASPADLVSLTRRLAEGLAAAHRLGVIHRDISPDNIMLPDGMIDHARIIDFGIAKDLGAGSATIVGDGFAGKLNYVAPEQLGEYGREIGPWTDVYSLALTILAVAGRANVNLGGSLVDAVDKRRKGVDIAGAPPELQDVLRKMLEHDPGKRFRTMEEVIAALDRLGTVTGDIPEAEVRIAGAAELEEENLPEDELTVLDPIVEVERREDKPSQTAFERTRLRLGLSEKAMLIVFAGALLVFVGLLWAVYNGSQGEGISASESVALTPEQQVDQAKETVAALLPTLECTSLSLGDAAYQDGGVALSISGVAGNADAAAKATSAITSSLEAAGVTPGAIDMAGVKTVGIADCRPIDVFKKFAVAGESPFVTGQSEWEIQKLGRDAGEYAGMKAAWIRADADLSAVKEPAHVLFLEKDQLILVDEPIASVYPALGKGRYRLDGVTDETGWAAIVLLIGKGPYDKSLLNGKLSAKRDWSEQFTKIATERGWKVEVHWFEVVDKVKN